MYKFAVTQCVVASSCSEDFILFKSWPPGVGRGHNGCGEGVKSLHMKWIWKLIILIDSCWFSDF